MSQIIQSGNPIWIGGRDSSGRGFIVATGKLLNVGSGAEDAFPIGTTNEDDCGDFRVGEGSSEGFLEILPDVCTEGVDWVGLSGWGAVGYGDDGDVGRTII